MFLRTLQRNSNLSSQWRRFGSKSKLSKHQKKHEVIAHASIRSMYHPLVVRLFNDIQHRRNSGDEELEDLFRQSPDTEELYQAASSHISQLAAVVGRSGNRAAYQRVMRELPKGTSDVLENALSTLIYDASAPIDKKRPWDQAAMEQVHLGNAMTCLAILAPWRRNCLPELNPVDSSSSSRAQYVRDEGWCLFTYALHGYLSKTWSWLSYRGMAPIERCIGEPVSVLFNPILQYTTSLAYNITNRHTNIHPHNNNNK